MKVAIPVPLYLQETMPRTVLVSVLLASAVAAALARQEPGSGSAAGDSAAPGRTATVLRFFCLEGDLKAEPIRKALAELSTQAAECRIAWGPESSPTRKDKQVLALESPAEVSAKDALKALRKGCPKAEELEWSLFRGAPEEPQPILGYSARDCVIGMTSDMRWFEFADGASAFFYLPGKLSAAEVGSLFKKLYGPFGSGDLGKIGS